MSTIGSLMALLSDPGIKPYNEQELTANRIQFGNTQNQTQLLDLADAKRQQEEAAATRAFLQQHPEFVFGGGGPPQSLLSQLAPAGGPAGGGPLTQQAFGGGQPPGAPQVVPGGQDLSRFAGVSPQGGGPIPPDMMRQLTPQVTPPQSTIGALGQQPQAQAPNPQQRLLELARTNPEAALKVQALMQGQQDAALKREETRLSTGTKVLEYVGRQAQGVSDQAGLVAMQQDLQRLGLHQYAAQLPEVYSKEAMQPFIAKATSVLETQTLQLTDLKSQREAMSNQQKLIWEQQQHGEKMGLDREKLGQQQTQQQQTQQQQTRSAEFNLQGEYNKLAQPYREVRDAMGRIEAAGTSPTAAGDAALLTAYMKMLDPTTGVRNEEIRNAENVGGLPQRARGWLEWLKGGAPLADDVRKDFMDRSKKLYEQYQKDYEQVGTQYREQASRQGLDPRNVVQDYRSTTPSGGRAALKPVGEMSREELLAERERLWGGR